MLVEFLKESSGFLYPEAGAQEKRDILRRLHNKLLLLNFQKIRVLGRFESKYSIERKHFA